MEMYKKQLTTYFKNRWGFYEYKRGYLKGTCPLCGRDDKAGFNPHRDFFHCFYCGNPSRGVDLVAKAEKVSNSEAFNIIRELDPFDVKTPKKKEWVKPNIFLPQGFKLLFRGRGTEEAEDYLIHERHLTKQVLKKAKVGVVLKDSGENFAGYIVFPYFQKGVLTYFQTRAYIPGLIKFKNPPEEEFLVKKTNVIYNIDCLSLGKNIAIMESVLNVLTWGLDAVAIGTKSVSPWQLPKLGNANCSYTILLDPDAIKEAYQLARKLVKFGRLVRVIVLPNNFDVNDLGREDVEEIIGDKPFTTNLLSLKVEENNLSKNKYMYII